MAAKFMAIYEKREEKGARWDVNVEMKKLKQYSKHLKL